MKRTASLDCPHCGFKGPHVIEYAGRLFVSSTCQHCAYKFRSPEGDLKAAYLLDLEGRIVSKPHRILHRIRRHPVGFLVNLPFEVLAQPRKFASEVRSIFSGHSSDDDTPAE